VATISQVPPPLKYGVSYHHARLIIIHPVTAVVHHSLPDDQTLAASGARTVLLFGLRRALRPIRVTASASTTVQLDALSGTSDTVALATAARRRRADGRWRGAVAVARAAEGWDVGLGIALLLAACLLLRGLGDVGCGELFRELVDLGLLEGFAADLGGLGWAGRRGALNLRWRERAALGDGRARDAALMAGCLGGSASGSLAGSGRGSRLRLRDVEGVQFAASSGLSDGLAGWVVGDVVAVDDVIVPVSLALLERGALEAERALPSAGLGWVLGKRELAAVVVPGAEQVDGLAVGGGSEGEIKLDGCHFDGIDAYDWLRTLESCRIGPSDYEQEELVLKSYVDRRRSNNGMQKCCSMVFVVLIV